MITLRFYEELNDFLPPGRRKIPFAVEYLLPRSVKDLIESLGVPHVEVDLVLVNGRSVDFGHRVADGDFISVYPVFERLDIGTVTRLRPVPLRETRFIADVHLKTLARKLRMLGFDTLFDPHLDDPQLAAAAEEGKRILLTRDLGLLKRGILSRGLFLRSQLPAEQLKEVVSRLDLLAKARPLTRCICCNALLERVPLEEVDTSRLPEDIRAAASRISRCGGCGRLYWRGSHYDRMVEEIRRLEEP
jgi:uncharacterized protein